MRCAVMQFESYYNASFILFDFYIFCALKVVPKYVYSSSNGFSRRRARCEQIAESRKQKAVNSRTKVAHSSCGLRTLPAFVRPPSPARPATSAAATYHLVPAPLPGLAHGGPAESMPPLSPNIAADSSRETSIQLGSRSVLFEALPLYQSFSNV